MDFAGSDLDTLGDKLDAIDLTDAERSALVSILRDAAVGEGDDVAGFAYDLNPNDLSFRVLLHQTTRGHKVPQVYVEEASFKP